MSEYEWKRRNWPREVYGKPPFEADDWQHRFSGEDQITGRALAAGWRGHTGGVWLREGQAFKPLFGTNSRMIDDPSMGVEETREAVALAEMADHPLFPKNWTVEWFEVAGHQTPWLVRPEVRVYDGKDLSLRNLRLRHLWQVEMGVRALNARRWEVNDAIEVGIYKGPNNRYHPMILDMSIAQPMGGGGAYAADDWDKIKRFWEKTQYGGEGGSLLSRRLAARRQAGQEAFWDRSHEFEGSVYQYPYTYGSTNRPFPWIGATMPECPYITIDSPNPRAIRVHSWMRTAEPLGDYARTHDLTLFWVEWPLPIPEEELIS